MDDCTVGVRAPNSKWADAKYAYDAVFAPSASTKVSPYPINETRKKQTRKFRTSCLLLQCFLVWYKHVREPAAHEGLW
jgi:hypothetical protein